MCWPSDKKSRGNTRDDVAFRRQRGEKLRKLLELIDKSFLKSKHLGNHFEHCDERLDLWTPTSPNCVLISRHISMPRDAFYIPFEIGSNDTMGFFDINSVSVLVVCGPA
jgi:hypothetical protein